VASSGCNDPEATQKMKKECRKKANTAWKPLDEENPLFEEENEEGTQEQEKIELNKVKKKGQGKGQENDTDAESVKDSGKDSPVFPSSAAAAAAAAPADVGPSGNKGKEAEEGGNHSRKSCAAHVANDR